MYRCKLTIPQTVKFNLPHGIKQHMNTEIKQLKVHLRNLLDGCSKKYNFRAHTNKT